MKTKRVLALLLSVALAAAAPVGALASEDSVSASTAEAADPCAQGHDYEETVVEPTCTEDGSITYTCRECGESYTEKGDKALGHDYDNGKVTREATEDEEGEMTFTCSRCGETYTESIPKLEKKVSAEKEDEEKDSQDKSGSGSESGSKKGAGSSGSGSESDSKKGTDSSAGSSKESAANQKANDTVPEKGAADSRNAEKAAALPLWFEGRQLTSADCADLIGGKSISYDEKTRTLTLNKAVYSFKAKDGEDVPAALIVYDCKDKGKTDLTIEIKGKCALSASAKKGLLSVVRVQHGSLILKGTGSLTVESTDQEAALYAKKDIVLFDGAKDKDKDASLTVRAKTIGLKAGENITVKSGTISVEASCKDEDHDDKVIDGIALQAKDIAISKDLEIAAPADGETLKDSKSKLATIVAGDTTTPAAKILISESDSGKKADGEKADNKKATDKKDKDEKNDTENTDADKAQAKNTDAKNGNNSEDGTEILEESGEGEEEEASERKYATGTNLATTYPLTINGVQVDSDNCGDIKGDGTIAYNPETKTLTLNGYVEELTATAPTSPVDALIYYTGTDDLTIEVKGNCSMTASPSTSTIDSVIRSDSASLILKGSGQLTIESEEEAAAIYSEKDINLFKDEMGPQTSLAITSRTAAIKAKGKIKMAAGLEITKPEGGSISEDETTITAKGQTAPAKEVTIQTKKFVVSFSGGGAKGSMDSVTLTAESDGKAPYTLPESGFTNPQCYLFSRWDINGTKYSAGTIYDVDKNITVKATWKKNHALTKQARVEPTCTEEGKKEHYACSKCGKFFSDENAKTEVTEDSLVLAALGHKYGDPTYTWSKDYSTCTAKRVCEHNKAHVEEEKAEATVNRQEPTCVEPGYYTYTASFKNAAFATQTKVIEKKAIGHKWVPTWNWNADYTKASFTLVCENDSTHNRTVSEDDVTVKGVITMPTTSKDGKVVRTATATLDGKEYTDSKQIAIKPAGKTGYKFVSSTTSSSSSSEPTYTWTKNSSATPPTMTVKRNEYDVITYSAFSKTVSVGGKTVSSSNYSYAKGSLKLTLKSSYLNTLSAGKHTIKVTFRDGTAQTTITVKGSSNSNSSNTNTRRTSTNSSAATRTSTSTNPATGDASKWITWLVLAAASASALSVILYIKRRSKKDQ